ncbi:hypothetical protein LB503_009525 [Fusarium chuoi]|nr:hypothetical protein LB503_009525 [Fusarium chuoi]
MSGGWTLASVKLQSELKRLLPGLNEIRGKPTPVYPDATGVAKDESIDLHLFVPYGQCEKVWQFCLLGY